MSAAQEAGSGARYIETTDLGAQHQAWDDLVLQQPVPSPFLRTWWLEAMPAAGRCFLLVLDGDRLIGGAPLVRDRLALVPRYRFVGEGPLCPDHLDLLAAPGREGDVAAAVSSWFTAPGTRIVDVDGLVDDSLLTRATGGIAHRRDVAPFQVLPETVDDYQTGRSSSSRRSVRRSEKRLAGDGFVHRRVPAHEAPEALAAFVALQSDREGREAMLDLFARLDTALTAGLARDEVQLDLIASPQSPAAVSLAYRVAGRLSLYQIARSTSREHDGAGTVMLSLLIRNAIDDGLREVDLLRGGESYKGSFVDESRTLHRLRVGHGLPARAVVAAWASASPLVRAARSAVARLRGVRSGSS